MKHEGRLWICPSNIWTYEQITALSEQLVNFGPRLKAQNQSFPGGFGLCHCKQHFNTVDDEMIIQAYPIIWLPKFAPMPTREGVAQLLRDVNLRICPHRSMSDPEIPECFRRRCIRGFGKDGGPCLCATCRRQVITESSLCHKCRTKVQFRRQTNADGSTTLYLVVGRFPLDGSILKKYAYCFWLDRMFVPSEMQRLKDEWETYTPLLVKDPAINQQLLTPERNPFAKGMRMP